ncbi:MAG: hypothetical protein M3P98_04180 [bacterium]|nr:hypothetical protein [bacterium]
MTAIYYPKLLRLTYWTTKENSNYQVRLDNVTLAQARLILKESMIRTELVQDLEIFS